jgi:hypothetical protein
MLGRPSRLVLPNRENGVAKQDYTESLKITKALAKKEGRMPAEVESRTRIEASQAGNGPLSGMRESGHKT